jgi:hypothetical protein
METDLGTAPGHLTPYQCSKCGQVEVFVYPAITGPAPPLQQPRIGLWARISAWSLWEKVLAGVVAAGVIALIGFLVKKILS